MGDQPQAHVENKGEVEVTQQTERKRKHRHKLLDKLSSLLRHGALPQEVENNMADEDLQAMVPDLLAMAADSTAILSLPPRLADVSKKGLLYRIPEDETIGDADCVVNLTELQRLGIQALRAELCRFVYDIRSKGSLDEKTAKKITRVMQKYCNALKDFDYMKKRHSDDISRDPFKLISSSWRDRAIMDEIESGKPPLFSNLGNMRWFPTDQQHPTLFGGDSRGSSKDNKERLDFLERLFLGLVGGIALVAPVILMVLVSGQTAHLVTTSVAVILFALGMARYHGSGASPFALVGATAAYAAVLVVFIGTST